MLHVPGPTRLTFDAFSQDPQGRTYADVLARAPGALRDALALMSEPAQQRRMAESELCHERPALAGVAKALEAVPSVAALFERGDARLAKRFRQAIGAACRILMEAAGWRKTGRKGSVGVGEHFHKAEHYDPPETLLSGAVAPRAGARSKTFLCLICADKLLEQMSDAEAAEHLAQYRALTASLRSAGQLLACNRLLPAHTATTVRVRRGKVSTSDGPFAETKELVGGYFLIAAKDRAEALRVAARIPGAQIGCVEVRPVARDLPTLRALGLEPAAAG